MLTRASSIYSKLTFSKLFQNYQTNRIYSANEYTYKHVDSNLHIAINICIFDFIFILLLLS